MVSEGLKKEGGKGQKGSITEKTQDGKGEQLSDRLGQSGQT